MCFWLKGRISWCIAQTDGTVLLSSHRWSSSCLILTTGPLKDSWLWLIKTGSNLVIKLKEDLVTSVQTSEIANDPLFSTSGLTQFGRLYSNSQSISNSTRNCFSSLFQNSTLTGSALSWVTMREKENTSRSRSKLSQCGPILSRIKPDSWTGSLTLKPTKPWTMALSPKCQSPLNKTSRNGDNSSSNGHHMAKNLRKTLKLKTKSIRSKIKLKIRLNRLSRVQNGKVCCRIRNNYRDSMLICWSERRHS